jgi:hypothetical protein
MLRHKGHLAEPLFIAVIFAIVFFVNLPLSKYLLLSPDACVYLDAGKNIFSGKGPVCSFNFYNYWPGKYYPLLPYTHPIYPLIAGFIWIFYGLKAVIDFNIFLLAVNSVLLFIMIRLKVKDRISAFLIVMIISFSKNMIFPSIYPWSEELHLTFILIGLLVYLKYNNIALASAIFTFGVFIRVAGLANLLALIPIVLLLRKKPDAAIKDIRAIAIIALIFIIPYEAFCFLKYGFLWPQYSMATMIWANSVRVGTELYSYATPTMDMDRVLINLENILGSIHNNFAMLIKSIGFLLPFFILSILAFAYGQIKKNVDKFYIVIMTQGIVVLFTNYLSPQNVVNPTNFLDALRYSMMPVALVSVAALSYIYEKLEDENQDMARGFIRRSVFWVLIFTLIIQVNNYMDYRKQLDESAKIEEVNNGMDRKKAYEWVKDNTAEGDIIASDDSCYGVLMDRPYVNLPLGMAITEDNVLSFLSIYRPKYSVVLYSESLKSIFRSIGSNEVYNDGNFSIFSTPPVDYVYLSNSLDE